jgi:hypothetical protein
MSTSPSPPLPPDHESLAGTSDAAVRKATGRDWAEWTALLDSEGARDRTHAEIARGLGETHGVEAWWAQTVTVGYERLRGLREPGQRREGSFDVNRSVTVPVPVARLFEMVRDEATRRAWAPDLALEETTATESRSIRWKGPEETRVEAWFVDKGAGKSSVQFQHRKLPDAAEADAEKARWGERVARLRELVKSQAG